MGDCTKTDNANLRAKLDLRRHFLRRYHFPPEKPVRTWEPVRVFDCCQAQGVMWKHLREEFPIAAYWGVDLVHKPGRLKVDSARMLSLGLTQNVIDVDTYGSPWKHWAALLTNVKHSCSVFLTIGLVKMGGGGNLDSETISALGLGRLKVPASIKARLSDMAVQYHLARAAESGFDIVECLEADPGSGGTARYLGVRLQRQPAGV